MLILGHMRWDSSRYLVELLFSLYYTTRECLKDQRHKDSLQKWKVSNWTQEFPKSTRIPTYFGSAKHNPRRRFFVKSLYIYIYIQMSKLYLSLMGISELDEFFAPPKGQNDGRTCLTVYTRAHLDPPKAECREFGLCLNQDPVAQFTSDTYYV